MTFFKGLAFVSVVVLFVALLVGTVAASVDRERLGTFRERIHKYFEDTHDAKIKELQAWIREASLPGNETGIQNLIAKRLAALGLEVDKYVMNGEELQQSPYFFSPRSEFGEESPIVVGVWKGTEHGKNKEEEQAAVEISVDAQQIPLSSSSSANDKKYHSIILNGHVDVVPVNDPSQWTRDPFSGDVFVDEKEGHKRIHGRGATDMKGGVFSSLLAIDALKALNLTLKGDVIFQSVVEEESGGSGTLSTILRGYKADAAIIPEPTQMKIFPKQQGSAWFRVTIKGLAAHGGTRYEGVSAIEKSMTVVQTILDLEKARNRREPLASDPLYKKIPIPVPINIGKIEGGKWPSSVPDEVKLEGRMGVSPYESIEEARAEMERTLLREDLPKRDPWFVDHPVTVEWFGAQWLPGNVPIDHPVMKSLTTAYEVVHNGEKPQVEGSPWGTDGGLLTYLANTPSVVFGPGDTALAHFRDESISLERVYRCAEVIALTLIDWCNVNNDINNNDIKTKQNKD